MVVWLSKQRLNWEFPDKTVFAIIGTMRSGSNYLERTLDHFDGVMCHGELFNDRFIGFHHAHIENFAGYGKDQCKRRNEDINGFMQAVVAASEGNVVGYRIFPSHLKSALQETIYNKNIRKIVLRRNILHSFVSLQIANQTDQWIVLHKGTTKPFEKIQFEINDFLAHAAQYALFYSEIYDVLNTSGQKYAIVNYDEVGRATTANRLATFLNLNQKIDKVPTTTLRQNPGSMRDLVANYDEMISELQKAKVARYFFGGG